MAICWQEARPARTYSTGLGPVSVPPSVGGSSTVISKSRALTFATRPSVSFEETETVRLALLGSLLSAPTRSVKAFFSSPFLGAVCVSVVVVLMVMWVWFGVCLCQVFGFFCYCSFVLLKLVVQIGRASCRD